MANQSDYPALSGACLWSGPDLLKSGAWLREWPSGSVEQFEKNLASIKAAGMEESEVTKADFPLPKLEEFFQELRDELEDGLGVIRIQGLLVERYDPADLRRLFWGIGTHLGTAVPQSVKGELLDEVKDETRINPEIGDEVRAQQADAAPILSSRARARSNGPLRFHSDGADLIALLCARNGIAGGESKIVSTAFLYNEIRRLRPDLHGYLCRPYHRYLPNTDRLPAENRVFAMPIFGIREGKLTCQYSRTFVEQAQEMGGVPKLDPAGIEALDLLAELAEKHCMTVPFEEGDVQLINNHVAFHGRTAFEDNVEAGKERLLLRLWLSPQNNRALPDGFEVFWGGIDAGVPRSSIRARLDALGA
jgi:hypothetical protein